MGTNLTPDEVARLRMKAKHGTLTADERVQYDAYEAEQRSVVQVEAQKETASIIQCPYCGHASIGVQIVSDVTQRNPYIVMAMMFAPLIVTLVGWLIMFFSHDESELSFGLSATWVFLFFVTLIPLWVFYRGPHSVTHRYYVCKRCGYVERDETWKIVNNGGGDIAMAVGKSIGFAVMLIIMVVMVLAVGENLKSKPSSSANNSSISEGFDSQSGGHQTIEDLGNGTILINE